MKQVSPMKHAYWNYLGRALAFAYFSRRRTFLGMSHSGWIKMIVVGLFFATILLRMPWPAVMISFLLMVWLFYSYRRAEKMGYNHFVEDNSATLPRETAVPLQPNEKIKLRASGTFALTGRDSTLLLRPAEYWYVPLGDHVTMVSETSTRYLYQFFTAKTLHQVRKGWILFGAEPLQTLEITFFETWGPEYDNNALLYFVGGGHDDNKKLKKRIIYFSFEQPDELLRVWQGLVKEAQKVREGMA